MKQNLIFTNDVEAAIERVTGVGDHNLIDSQTRYGLSICLLHRSKQDENQR